MRKDIFHKFPETNVIDLRKIYRKNFTSSPLEKKLMSSVISHLSKVVVSISSASFVQVYRNNCDWWAYLPIVVLFMPSSCTRVFWSLVTFRNRLHVLFHDVCAPRLFLVASRRGGTFMRFWTALGVQAGSSIYSSWHSLWRSGILLHKERDYETLQKLYFCELLTGKRDPSNIFANEIDFTIVKYR